MAEKKNTTTHRFSSVLVERDGSRCPFCGHEHVSNRPVCEHYESSRQENTVAYGKRTFILFSRPFTRGELDHIATFEREYGC